MLGTFIFAGLEPFTESSFGVAFNVGYEFASHEKVVNGVYEDSEQKCTKHLSQLVSSLKHEHIPCHELWQYTHATRHKHIRHNLNKLGKAISRAKSSSWFTYFLIGSAFGLHEGRLSIDVIRERIDHIPQWHLSLAGGWASLQGHFLQVARSKSLGEAKKALREIFSAKVVLFISSTAIGQTLLDIDTEWAKINSALRNSHLRHTLVPRRRLNCDIDKLSHLLQSYRPYYVHISCHGDEKGLWLRDRDSRGATYSYENLARILKRSYQDNLRGVFLSCCHGADGAQVIANAVGQVVAMNGEVLDKQAIQFSKAFYQSLGTGRSWEQAYQWAMDDPVRRQERTRLQAQLFTSHSSKPQSYSKHIRHGKSYMGLAGVKMSFRDVPAYSDREVKNDGGYLASYLEGQHEEEEYEDDLEAEDHIYKASGLQVVNDGSGTTRRSRYQYEEEDYVESSEVEGHSSYASDSEEEYRVGYGW